MFAAVVRKLAGTPAERRLRKLGAKVAAVAALEPEVRALDDAALRARTEALRARLAAGETTADVLVPAFAIVREAARRALGQRHYDVQALGGMVLHDGAIAEMRTGEGKTLVSTLAAYLVALEGKGVHVVTVNEYLARRDAEEMGRVHRFLGLTVGVVTHGMTHAERKAAYLADITYGTNNEFGFDYLRDNMALDAAGTVQRGHHFALLDEVDSILIDEARTPLIISGPAGDGGLLPVRMDMLARQLRAEHVQVDEGKRTVALTDAGEEEAEAILGDMGFLEDGSPYDSANATVIQHMRQALLARHLYLRDRDYVVRDGEVIIVDVGTGRMMPGRRYGDGLHQAIEVKEGVETKPETVTLASVTFQNYFRLYAKLSGMTGTGSTEAAEFAGTYGLPVVEIPTHRPVARIDDRDEVYRTEAEKLDALVREVADANDRHQPVLVGTTSVEKSEALADRLERAGFRRLDLADVGAVEAMRAAATSGEPTRHFAVLNARSHDREATIVAEAGLPGSVTVATNMAGRGTDIRLGGSADARVAEACAGMDPGPARDAAEAAMRAGVASLAERAHAAGGLFVIGSERHESRRVDDQLRGRSGRQGDPGRSRFMLSLEDDLVRLFGGQNLDRVLERMGLRQGDAIAHPFVDAVVGRAQRRVEGRNYDIRKEVLRYDEVVDLQRRFVFGQRRDLLREASLEDKVAEMREGVVEEISDRFMPKGSYPEAWDVAGLAAAALESLALEAPVAAWAAEEGVDGEDVAQRLLALADEAYAQRVAAVGPDTARLAERLVTLQCLDALWREHIVSLESLRQVIGWRGAAQREPIQEFKHETHELFQDLVLRLRRDVTRALMRLAPAPAAGPAEAGVP